MVVVRLIGGGGGCDGDKMVVVARMIGRGGGSGVILSRQIGSYDKTFSRLKTHK